MPNPKYTPKIVDIIAISVKFATFRPSGITDNTIPLAIQKIKKISSLLEFVNKKVPSKS